MINILLDLQAHKISIVRIQIGIPIHLISCVNLEFQKHGKL